MEIIKKTIRSVHKLPEALSNILQNNNTVIFDIETTGLSASYNKVILIGILYFQNNDIIIEQYFAQNSNEEKDLLVSFIKKFNEFDYYISYNGHSFDIPFLNKRLSKNNIQYKIDPYINIDLYRIVRKYKSVLGLGDCKLKTIEKFLGINREDIISGGESVKLYKEYELYKDEELKRKILLHNYEDILHLLPTLKVLDFFNTNQIFHFLPQEICIDNKDSLKIRITDYKIINDFLYVKGNFIGKLKQDYIIYETGYSYSITKDNNSFEARLSIINIDLPSKDCYTYINIDDIDIIDAKLVDLNHNERNEFLIRVNKNIDEIKAFKFLRKILIK